MKTHLIRIEQEDANTKEIDRIVNEKLQELEKEGHTIQDIRLAIGRDADKNSGITLRYCVSIIVLYD